MKIKSVKKYGALPYLYGGAIALVVAAIGAAIGGQVLQTIFTTLQPAGFGSTNNASSVAMNVTAQFQNGLSQLSSFGGVMGIVIAAVVIISLVTLLGRNGKTQM